jgi:hypothetical protein
VDQKRNQFIYLEKGKNEYGGTFSILYDKSTSSNNGRDLGFNIWVVGNVTANNSLTGIFNILGKTSYRYSGGKFDYSNSEFLGFANVNETLPDGSITSHFFHQDTALKGKEHTTIIHDKSNKKIKQILNRYTNTSDKKVYLNATSELNYEGNQPQSSQTLLTVTIHLAMYFSSIIRGMLQLPEMKSMKDTTIFITQLLTSSISQRIILYKTPLSQFSRLCGFIMTIWRTTYLKRLD